MPLTNLLGEAWFGMDEINIDAMKARDMRKLEEINL